MPDTESVVTKASSLVQQAKEQESEIDARIAEKRAQRDALRVEIAQLVKEKVEITRVANSLKTRAPYKRGPRKNAGAAAPSN